MPKQRRASAPRGRGTSLIKDLLNTGVSENPDFQSGQQTQDIQQNITASGGSAEDYPMLKQEQQALGQGPFNRAPWYSRLFGAGQQANDANAQYLLTKNLAPLENQQFATQQGIVSQEDLKRQQQSEDFKSLLQGQSLSQLASGGAIPYSGNIYGSNYQDIGRNYNTLTGSYGNLGALAGVPAAQAGAATSEYNKNLTQGRTPYAYPLGVNQAMNEIEQQNVQRETARPAEDARILLIKANALNNSYTQGGFHLGASGLPDSFAFKPEHFQQTTTEHETMVGPDGKTIVLPSLKPVTKPVTIGMRLGNIPSGVTPEEDMQTRGNLQPVTQQPSSGQLPIQADAPSPMLTKSLAPAAKPDLNKTIQDLLNSSQITRENAMHIEGQGKTARTVFNEPKGTIQNYIDQLKGSIGKQKPNNRQAIMDKIAELEGLLQ